MKALSRQPISRLPRISVIRSGFTLIELMIVIVIITLLVGLVLPGVISAFRTARVAEVRKDISDLETGITTFKQSFGIEPPSRITLYAAPADWTSAMYSPENKRSLGLLRQMWPKFDFAKCGGASDGTNFLLTDLTGTSTPVTLNGAECLVFFLGGIIDGSSGGLVGFAKDPARPFAQASGTGAITNREGPFFTFKGARVSAGNFNGRLVNTSGNAAFPEYKDPLTQQTKPYLYFSASTGSYATQATNTALPISATNPWVNVDCLGIMPNAYYSKFLNTVPPQMSVPYKPKGIQIISPGPDTNYGFGGLFDPDKVSALPLDDKDNITNFHPGRLGG